MQKLKLGILRVHEKSKISKISDKTLSQLVTNTLNISPLGEIIDLTHIKTIDALSPKNYSQEKYHASKFPGAPDIIAVIKKNAWVHYDKETRLVYSDTNPINLAHEIGHWLELSHPTFDCGQFCEKYYAEIKCKFSREIMGCAGEIGETTGFSKSDIKILRAEYLS